MPGHLTTVSESLLLRSPKASEGQGGALGEAEALRRGNTVGVRDQIMDLMADHGVKVSRAERNDLLPTPNTMEHLPARTGEARERILHRGDMTGSRRSSVGNLREDILDLLPTPVTTDHKQNDSSSAWERHSPQMGTIVHSIQWGKFAPAISRWETVLGRQAPAPTKPDGKDGAHRLSADFVEWMMGLNFGWVTDCGLTRNEMLKALGNGVVPQQAALALQVLLSGIDIERERERERTVMFPTPTVSDTFTDNLGSTQQKPGSMHSVTLPQAVRMIDDTEQD